MFLECQCCRSSPLHTYAHEMTEGTYSWSKVPSSKIKLSLIFPSGKISIQYPCGVTFCNSVGHRVSGTDSGGPWGAIARAFEHSKGISWRRERMERLVNVARRTLY